MVFLFFTVIGFYSNIAFSAPAAESKLFLGSHYFSYFTNSDFKTQNNSIQTLVLVVHGSDLNANTYYDSIEMAAHNSGHDGEVLIISPHFKTPSIEAPAAGEVSFSDEGWLRGDEALNDSQITSFQIIDQLIEQALNSNLFPALKTVVLTGHSAGGQLTQRYALGSLLQSKYPDIHFRYVVLNPGSYTYLNAKRPDASNTSLTFSVPDSSRCQTYDSYKYGLQSLNAYLSQSSPAEIINRYLKKEVIYLLGELDTNTGGGLDQSCEASLQGSYRLERGLFFKSFLDQNYPNHAHHLITVPQIGHSERLMYISSQGLSTLFSF